MRLLIATTPEYDDDRVATWSSNPSTGNYHPVVDDSSSTYSTACDSDTTGGRDDTTNTLIHDVIYWVWSLGGAIDCVDEPDPQPSPSPPLWYSTARGAATAVSIWIGRLARPPPADIPASRAGWRLDWDNHFLLTEDDSA